MSCTAGRSTAQTPEHCGYRGATDIVVRQAELKHEETSWRSRSRARCDGALGLLKVTAIPI